jgi:hypothetical protein
MKIKILSLFALISTSVSAQFIKNPSVFVQAGAYLATSNQNPFWIRSNQYGTVPVQSQILQIGGGYKTEYDSTRYSESNKLKKKFDYAFGGELVTNLGKANQIILPEVYFKSRLGIFEAYLGRRREIFGLVDTTLTSGSYIWSGNALPIPKLQISIPNYVSLNKKGNIALKGTFAHGWFGNQTSVKNFYLHQKMLYARFGKESAKFKFYTGFNHQVQWGGYNTRYKQQFATGFYPFLYSVLPLKGVSKKASSNLLEGDLQNRVGNQLGSIDILFEYRMPNNKMLSVYRQSLYDQGAALLRLANIKDGLNGISITNLNKNSSFHLKRLNFEFLYTLNQGTEPILFTKVVAWELENYFMHFQYTNGWSYNNKIIGTPFVTNYNETSAEFPASFQDINNNRVKVFYLSAIAEKTNDFNLSGRFSFSENYGIRDFIGQNLKYLQFSWMIQFDKNLAKKKILLSTSLGSDSGKLYKNNIGLGLNIQKIF